MGKLGANAELAEPWWMYTRKSRHLDRNIPETELFRRHKDSLFRLAEQLGLPGNPEDHYFQEVGTSESVEARPEITLILSEIDQLPYRGRAHLLLMDQDRLTRGDALERASLFDRLQLKGVVLHQVLGGDVDLNDLREASLAELKAVINRLHIVDYKIKRGQTWEAMLLNGEIRQGKVPLGYWWDDVEKYSRDRIKPDTRDEKRIETTGLTRWETLCRCCQEVLHTSVAQLANKYGVKRPTLYSTLETPTIAGWPVKRTEPVRDENGRVRRDRKGRIIRRRLPREQWTWPEKAGTYPAACTLEQWEVIQVAINSRKNGQVKTNQGDGPCREVVCFTGVSGPIVLGTINDKEKTPSYRVLPNGRGCNRGAMDVPRKIVDAHAVAALRKLVTDAPFFAWMISEYYQNRKEAEPEDTDRELREVSRQIDQWTKEMETARALALQAELDEERSLYSEDVRRLLRLIKTWKEKKATLKAARSAIPAVDLAIPALLQTAQEYDPAFWGRNWDEVWAAFSPSEQRLFVNMCLKAVPVEYHRPTGPAKGAYKGPAERVLLPVQYSDFVESAQQSYAAAGLLLNCKIADQQSLVGVWKQIAALAKFREPPCMLSR